MSRDTPLRLPRLPTEATVVLRKRLILGDFSRVSIAERSFHPNYISESRPYRDCSPSLDPVQMETEEKGLRGRVHKLKPQKRRTASQTASSEVLDLSTSQKQIVRRPKLKPEFNSQVRSYLSSTFSRAIRRSNGLPTSLKDHGYKFYVGFGNNDQLVSLLLKRRWYWTRVDNSTLADFIWTQNRSAEIIQRLPVSDLTLTLAPLSLHTQKRLPRALISQVKQRNSGLALITSSPNYQLYQDVTPAFPFRLYNRLDKTHQITSKKCLFLNIKQYYEERNCDPFEAIPMSFLIENAGEIGEFQTEFERRKGRNLWIVKPGENTNCGYGIHVTADLATIKSLVKSANHSLHRSFIIQKYIENPLLISHRKFDIRCYGLITTFHSHVQGYFYHDGYLRTSSKEFTLSNVEDRFIHLTNDAVQKTSEDYGRFENGNKLSYPEFEKYLRNFHSKVDFWKDIWTQIRQLTIDSMHATWSKLDPSHRCYTFEILGYDFMVDEDYKVWLIEVNTNPCLALSAPYLAKVIPEMLDNAFRIVLDPYFPEPVSKKHLQEWASQPFENRFELVFSSSHINPAVSHEELSDYSADSSVSPA